MNSINFTQIPGTAGRGWKSEDGVWEIAMMGLGRYRLFHLLPFRTVAGNYQTLGEAKDWAERIASIMPKS